MNDFQKRITVAIAWCLAWGEAKSPQEDIQVLRQMRRAMMDGKSVPDVAQPYLEQIQQLKQLDDSQFPANTEALIALTKDYADLWNNRIGLVYGGATKIKQYVFEASKLQDIRGASALLDSINLVDLPAFFNTRPKETLRSQFDRARQWLVDNFDSETETPSLSDALIPELIIYSTGGNILAFCPEAYVDDLANAIEKRYTTETLTANSCAVGQAFRFLELRYGLLKDDIRQTLWLDWYLQNATQPLVEAIFGKVKDNATDPENLTEQFKERKSFNELVRRLAVRFNQRRSGDDRFLGHRSTRRYPPMFETHPYGKRDEEERRLALRKIETLPRSPWFSETSARKRIVGQRVKRDKQNTSWYSAEAWHWEPGEFEGWITRYERFLEENPDLAADYNPNGRRLLEEKKEARSLREIGNASDGFIAYIYADGNNMGGYIQTIKTAQDYQRFSEAVSHATEQCVYLALAEHLEPHQLSGIDDAETKGRDGQWIHPFEILTIGGDDVMLVVPANKALAIAQTLCKQFELLLPEFGQTQQLSQEKLKAIHRYRPETAKNSGCNLSMSAGVLITAENTPIYYAENLTSQLLKSAKSHAKALKKHGYHGGTIDFLVMKAVTMLSSTIKDFREAGLIFGSKPKLKLYGAPYTLHEIEGLLETAEALKKADFPRSQLYQIRSLLERGKHTAMLNYRYFWSRLNQAEAKEKLKEEFEDAWCKAKTNGGNLVPWIHVEPSEADLQNPDYVSTYETIWRELVDLYPFIDEPEQVPEKTTVTNREVQ
jgi:CRISPR-associated protein Cmr2